MIVPEAIEFLALHHLHWTAGISGGHRSGFDVLRSGSVRDGSLSHGVRHRLLLLLLVLVACHALLVFQLWRLRSSRNKTGAAFKPTPRQQPAVGLPEASAASSTFSRSPHSPHQRALHSSSRRSPGGSQSALTSECSCRRCASKSLPPTLHHRYGVFFRSRRGLTGRQNREEAKVVGGGDPLPMHSR